ncbi:MAG: ribosome-associated translation inhibitor RaiA [bacterium]
MKINTTFRHMDSDDDIRSYVEDKLEKLAGKYFRKPQEANVIMEAEKFRRSVEIILRADNMQLTSKEEKEDLRSAADLALDKLEKQTRKKSKKIDKKKNRGNDLKQSFAVYRGGPETAPLEEAAEPEVIKVDKFIPKPMSVDDAIVILEEQGDDFMVYRDSESMGIAVIYRRPDGNYGLIEPE